MDNEPILLFIKGVCPDDINDINEFLDQLNTEQFMGVTNFFETMPKLRHTIEVTNPKTNVTSEVLLEGLQSFLG